MMDELDSVRSGIPPSWVVKKLEVLSRKITKGATPTTYGYEFQDFGVNFIKIENISNGLIELSNIQTFISEEAHKNQGRSILEENDILFSIAGTIGQTCIVRKKDLPANTNQALAIISGSADCLVPEFLEFQLRSAVASRAKAKARGGAMNNISLGDLRSLQILVPPLSEQHRIVAKIEELFSELDKGIESLKTAQAQLKVYRQAVLKHAFEGKLTAQWREENKDKLEKPGQLLARIKQEREVRYERQLKEWEAAVKKWEESGKSGRQPSKPQKPKNPLPLAVSPVDNPFWTRLFLDELAAEAVLGKMLDREKNTGTPRYYLGNINLRWGKFDLENLKTMKVEESEIERYRLAKGDLVICEGGEPGRCAVWEGQESTMLIQKALHRVRFTESYSPYFAYYFVTYAASSGLLSPNFTGSTIKHLTGKGLGNVLFPLCTLAEQNQVVHLLDRAFNTSDELDRQIECEIRRSNSLRQSVLRKAFSGQLVPQDPNDEPASVLLDRIRAEREKVAENNHSKKTKKRRTTV